MASVILVFKHILLLPFVNVNFCLNRYLLGEQRFQFLLLVRGTNKLNKFLGFVRISLFILRDIPLLFHWFNKGAPINILVLAHFYIYCKLFKTNGLIVSNGY